MALGGSGLAVSGYQLSVIGSVGAERVNEDWKKTGGDNEGWKDAGRALPVASCRFLVAGLRWTSNFLRNPRYSPFAQLCGTGYRMPVSGCRLPGCVGRVFLCEAFGTHLRATLRYWFRFHHYGLPSFLYRRNGR
jgi:hypothetical protein